MSLKEKLDKVQSYRELNSMAISELMQELCIAEVKEIETMIDYAIDKYNIEVSFWILLLSYRLAILQDSKNYKLLESAARYIQIYGGPEFEYIADDYLEKAKKMNKED